MAREYQVEMFLSQQMELIGGAAEKHVNTGVRGDPDRLCCFPMTRYTCLVETKWAEGEQPEAHQLRRHAWWRKRGIDVYVLRSKKEVQNWLLGPVYWHWHQAHTASNGGKEVDVH